MNLGSDAARTLVAGSATERNQWRSLSIWTLFDDFSPPSIPSGCIPPTTKAAGSRRRIRTVRGCNPFSIQVRVRDRDSRRGRRCRNIVERSAINFAEIYQRNGTAGRPHPGDRNARRCAGPFRSDGIIGPNDLPYWLRHAAEPLPWPSDSTRCPLSAVLADAWAERAENCVANDAPNPPMITSFRVSVYVSWSSRFSWTAFPSSFCVGRHWNASTPPNPRLLTNPIPVQQMALMTWMWKRDLVIQCYFTLVFSSENLDSSLPICLIWWGKGRMAAFQNMTPTWWSVSASFDFSPLWFIILRHSTRWGGRIVNVIFMWISFFFPHLFLIRQRW